MSVRVKRSPNLYNDVFTIGMEKFGKAARVVSETSTVGSLHYVRLYGYF